MMLPGGVAVNSVQFEMESWTGAQRVFAVKSFYKNNDSYVATQREIRKKFGIHRNSKVPSSHTIRTWVNNFEETGSTVKKKGGSVLSGRTWKCLHCDL
jgi:transposase